MVLEIICQRYDSLSFVDKVDTLILTALIAIQENNNIFSECTKSQKKFYSQFVS